MAFNSVQIIEDGGATSREYAVEAATTILAGEPVKLGGTGGNYVRQRMFLRFSPVPLGA